MIVKITDFASGDVNFVEYSVFGLSSEQLNFLNDNLDEKTCIADDALIIRTCENEWFIIFLIISALFLTK